MRISLPCTNGKKTRRWNPLCAKNALRHRLVHRECGGAHARSGVRNAKHIQHPLQNAVLTVLPVQCIKYNGGAELLNLLGKGFWLQFHADGRIVFRAQSLKNRRPRVTRYFSLRGRSAHDDDDGLLPRAGGSRLQLCDQCLTDL